MEEIFGEIEDEHDQEDRLEEVLEPGVFLFSGRMEIDHLNEKYGLFLPEGDYHTLSGYLVTTTEDIPEQGEVLELGDYRFHIELVSNTRIETVKIEEFKKEE